jgi:DHA2 family multidrug resistance protein
MTMALIGLIPREPKATGEERERARREGGGFDLMGFVLVATFLGSLQITLDRGSTTTGSARPSSSRWRSSAASRSR